MSSVGAYIQAVAVILAIILVALLLARWIEHVLGSRVTVDRRRQQTLYMVTRVSLQVRGQMPLALRRVVHIPVHREIWQSHERTTC